MAKPPPRTDDEIANAYQAGMDAVAAQVQRLNREAMQRLAELPDDGTPERQRKRAEIIRILSVINQTRR